MTICPIEFGLNQYLKNIEREATIRELVDAEMEESGLSEDDAIIVVQERINRSIAEAEYMSECDE